MFGSIDDITIEYKEGDQILVKELDKRILTRGAWTTIVFRYQQWEPRNNKFSNDKYSIRRYRKQNDEYMQKSKFNISNRDQAQEIVNCLNSWI